MFLAQVVGTLVAPVQIPVLNGHKLLIVRPLTPDGKRTGKTRVALDRARAGVGDRVLVVDEGNSARGLLGDPKAAVKCVIVGVVDFVDTHTRVYDHREPRRESAREKSR